MPLFDYADIVWGDKNNVQLMNHLQVMQNNAARLILDFPARASGTQALEVLKLQPLHLRRFYHRCLMVFKCKNGNIDFNFGVKKNNQLTVTPHKDATITISRKYRRTGENKCLNTAL